MLTNLESQPIGEKKIKLLNEEGKKVIIFGVSKRNTSLDAFLDGVKIYAIFDNNPELWGKMINGIPVKKPCWMENTIVISAIYKYREIAFQLKKLNFEEVYLYIEDERYNISQKFLDMFHRNEFETVICSTIKYIHVIPDQKFILPVIQSLKKLYPMNEHLFLIFSLNSQNPNDIYRNWELTKQLQKEYQNVCFVDERHNIFFYDWNEKLHELDDFVEKCDRIIFHGEWLCDEVADYFAEYKALLRKKAIWIVWSGNAGKDEITIPYIQKTLCHVGGIVFDGNYIFDIIASCCNIRLCKKIDTKFAYAIVVEPPDISKKKRNIIICHSCFVHDQVMETLELLSRFSGDIDVYCITSYGNEAEIKRAEERGREIYGVHFHSINKFMEYEDYVELIAHMDAGVFAQERGAGYDTLQILFWTKGKVYVKRGSNTEKMMSGCGYHTYAYEDIKTETIEQLFDNHWVEHNFRLSDAAFDYNTIKKHWDELLGSDLLVK